MLRKKAVRHLPRMIYCRRMFELRLALLWVVAPLLYRGLLSFQIAPAASFSERPPPQLLGAQRANSGETLARIYCASCHLFPEPDLLDKKTWNEQALPRMSIRLGLAPEEID